MMPTLFLELCQKSNFTCPPERRLLIAILYQAIFDGMSGDKALKNEARGWLWQKDGGCFVFDLLDIDTEWMFDQLEGLYNEFDSGKIKKPHPFRNFLVRKFYGD
jgi:hypothetical protein